MRREEERLAEELAKQGKTTPAAEAPKPGKTTPAAEAPKPGKTTTWVELPKPGKANREASQGAPLTLAEVSKHNTKDDCWLVIAGKVYDVTKFLDDHPGGDDVLLSSTAKDATDDFEDVGHSTTARAMLDEYYIGDIDSATIPTQTKYTAPKQPHYNQDKTQEFIIKILQFLVPLAILGLAVAVRMYTKSESS